MLFWSPHCIGVHMCVVAWGISFFNVYVCVHVCVFKVQGVDAEGDEKKSLS